MNDLQELEQMLSEFLSGIQEVLQSGEILTDEFQGQLAQTLNLLTSRIDELKAVPDAQPIGNLEEAMPSSNISGFRYDEKTGKLLVQFLGKHPDRNGSVYAYDGVPKQIYELFRQGAVPARTKGQNKWGKWWKGKVPSAGASMYTLIKSMGYPYRRLS